MGLKLLEGLGFESEFGLFEIECSFQSGDYRFGYHGSVVLGFG